MQAQQRGKGGAAAVEQHDAANLDLEQLRQFDAQRGAVMAAASEHGREGGQVLPDTQRIGGQHSALTFLAGWPAYSPPGASSPLTTLPAATTTLSPITAPGSTMTPAPMNTLLPMRMSASV
ncbi:hypothetical protein D3C78_1613480 [compost metagenome]